MVKRILYCGFICLRSEVMEVQDHQHSWLKLGQSGEEKEGDYRHKPVRLGNGMVTGVREESASATRA